MLKPQIFCPPDIVTSTDANSDVATISWFPPIAMDNSGDHPTVTSLPVIHLTCWPANEKPLLQDPVKAAETYACPVYNSRFATGESILEIDLSHSGVPATKWALRGLSATVRPF